MDLGHSNSKGQGCRRFHTGFSQQRCRPVFLLLTLIRIFRGHLLFMAPHDSFQSKRIKLEDNRGSFVEKSIMRKTNSVSEWLGKDSFNYKGLLFPRPLTQTSSQQIQQFADQLAESGRLGRELGVERAVSLVNGDALTDGIAQIMSTVAPPIELSKMLDRDARVLVGIYQAMFPDLQEVSIKVELLGENCCSRFHQDTYVCRSIVSYNLAATEYIEDVGVDFWELENCGKNDCIVKDPSMVRQVHIGDMMLMKGTLFPWGAKGLVHRSPAITYSDTGRALHRLVLKVDIPKVDSD